MTEIISRDDAKAMLTPIGKSRMSRTGGKCHSPAARAKAGATRKARKAAADAARGEDKAQKPLPEERDEWHDRIVAAGTGEYAKLTATLAARVLGAVSSGWVGRDTAEWEAQVNRWAEEFIARWKARQERQRHDPPPPRDYSNQVLVKNTALVHGWLADWSDLGRLQGCKAAFIRGVEMGAAGETIPEILPFGYGAGEPGERKEHSLAIYLAALRQGFEVDWKTL